MSLKAFHIVFIVASTLLALVFAGWGFGNYFTGNGSGVDLIYGIGSLIAAIALVVYGIVFLRKLKHISYL